MAEFEEAPSQYSRFDNAVMSMTYLAKMGWLFPGVLACLLFGGAHAQARFDFAQTRTVLPKTVVPRHYALTLDLDPAKSTFDGRVLITVRIDQPTDRIVLHADKLTLRKAWLAPVGAISEVGEARHFRPLVRAKTAEPPQTWTLRTQDGQALAAGVYDLEISYRGQVQTAGEGLYRADHRVAGKPAAMLATQLQAVKGCCQVLTSPCFAPPSI
jgi:hypothetical protein